MAGCPEAGAANDQSKMPSKIRDSFCREVAKADRDINLAYAAMLFSEYLAEPFDSTLYLSLLDEMATIIEQAVLAAKTDLEIIKAINQYLFEELKFSGNQQNYYVPQNSFLNMVLDLRLGIPISLSAIYLELGWRLGLPMWGIGLPGHFIVGYGSTTDPIYIDVFGQGRILSEEECIDIARGSHNSRDRIKNEYLKPISKRAILFRMLLNLKQIYVGLENWETAYKVVDLMCIAKPKQINEVRDRGLLAYRLNRLHAAIFDIERYLFLARNSPDTAWLKQHLETMEEKLLRLN